MVPSTEFPLNNDDYVGRSPDNGAYLVFGGTGEGVGSRVCRSLADAGHRVLAVGRSVVETAKVGEVLHMRGDASSFDDVERCFDAAQEYGEGRIRAVATCVGSMLLKPAHQTTIGDWAQVIGNNLTTAFSVVRAAGLKMQSGGAVVLCSSAAASVGLANHEALSAAKAGVEGLVRSAAATYASRGLRVNAVAPGPLAPYARSMPVADQDLLAKALPALPRAGQPADVASAILWLLDGSQSGWVTGATLSVDGGLADVRGGSGI